MAARAERRLRALERKAPAIGHRRAAARLPQYQLTPEQALEVADILAACGALEDVIATGLDEVNGEQG